MDDNSFVLAEGLIDGQKSGADDGFKALAQRDFTYLAKEYFEIDGKVKLTIEKREGNFLVSVSFTARHLKNCHMIKNL